MISTRLSFPGIHSEGGPRNQMPREAAVCASWRNNCYRLVFLEQHHIGWVVGTGDSESFPIGRPLKFGINSGTRRDVSQFIPPTYYGSRSREP